MYMIGPLKMFQIQRIQSSKQGRNTQLAWLAMIHSRTFQLIMRPFSFDFTYNEEK